MLPFINYNILTPTTMSESKTIIRSNNNDNKRRNKRWTATLYTGGGGGGGGGDERAVVKAAAWAWYQRNEGKSMMKEFDFTPKVTRKPRPSRYKLEADNNMIISQNKVSSMSPLWYTDHIFRENEETRRSTLLDTYEIKRISKRIDDSLPSDPTSVLRHDHEYDYIHDDHDFLHKKLEYNSSYNGKESTGLVKKVNKKSLWKGMILMAPRTVCGRSDDVDLLAHRSARKTVKVTAASVKTRIVRQ